MVDSFTMMGWSGSVVTKPLELSANGGDVSGVCSCGNSSSERRKVKLEVPVVPEAARPAKNEDMLESIRYCARTFPDTTSRLTLHVSRRARTCHLQRTPKNHAWEPVQRRAAAPRVDALTLRGS